jgi:rhodanese-related sulfurtransferase
MFNIKELEVQDLHGTAGLAEKYHIIDVRSPSEVAMGAIPGAVNIPLYLLPMRVNDIPDDKETLLYCRSGARSAQACAFLMAQGKRNVFNLRGGIIAWAQNGMAIA